MVEELEANSISVKLSRGTRHRFGDPPSRYTGTMRLLNCNPVDIEENGVRFCLTVVDTPGFGDFVNNGERFARHFSAFRLPFILKRVLSR